MAGTESEKPAPGGNPPARGSRRARIQKEREAIQREAKSKQFDEFKTYLKDLFPGKQKYYAAGIGGGVLVIVCFVIWQLSPGPTVDRDSGPPPNTAWLDGKPRPTATYTAPKLKEPQETKK